MNGRKAGFQKEITATGSGGGEMRGGGGGDNVIEMRTTQNNLQPTGVG